MCWSHAVQLVIDPGAQLCPRPGELQPPVARLVPGQVYTDVPVEVGITADELVVRLVPGLLQQLVAGILALGQGHPVVQRGDQPDGLGSALQQSGEQASAAVELLELCGASWPAREREVVQVLGVGVSRAGGGLREGLGGLVTPPVEDQRMTQFIVPGVLLRGVGDDAPTESRPVELEQLAHCIGERGGEPSSCRCSA